MAVDQVSCSQRSADSRTLSRDTKAVVEREQALLLIRAVSTLAPLGTVNNSHPEAGWPDILGQRVPLTGGLIRAIVAIAENSQDAMWIVCMETLVEIGRSTFWN